VGVAAATAQLRDMASDESLFAIEDKELGGEGVVEAAAGAETKPKWRKQSASQSSSPERSTRIGSLCRVVLTEHLLLLLETACW